MTNDTISADAIGDGLQTRILGHRIVYHEQVGSTNDAAKQLAETGEPEGTLVIADEQTAGRGRLARTWVAPPRSSILMSLILHPGLAPHQAPRVTMVVALGACDAIHAETGLNAAIKWPNDILLNGKKCAGILAESGIVGDKLEYVIVGLGVNVNFALTDIIQVATSDSRFLPFGETWNLNGNVTTIADEMRKPCARVPLIQSILRSIENYYLRLRAGENLREEFANRLTTLGKSIQAQTPWGIEAGVAEDVDDDGALQLRRADNSLVRLVAGEVTLAKMRGG